MLQPERKACHSDLFKLKIISAIVIVIMKMLKIIIAILTAISACSLLLLLNYTSPTASGPFGILAVFVFIYISSFGLLSFATLLFSFVLNKLSELFMMRKPIEVLLYSHCCYYSTVFSLAIVMLIGLGSVGAASVYGVLLILFFLAVGCLYISKKTQ